METKEKNHGVEMNPWAFALAGMTSVVGGGFLGLAALAAIVFRGSGGDLWPLLLLSWILAGASGGASLAALFALLCGAELGRWFACVFATCLTCIAAWFFVVALWLYDVQYDQDMLTLIGFLCVILVGVAGGAFLAGRTWGYLRRARILAAVGLVLMLLAGCFFVSMHRVRIGDGATSTLAMFGLFGGVLGAMLGSTRRRPAG
ncbi:MAG: hypothetical protein QGH94_07680 [Phycisphaerae bacterium]|jgi:hypothetical protein|nr:hypothetical protein [Phycisphaerae bacterium]